MWFPIFPLHLGSLGEGWKSVAIVFGSRWVRERDLAQSMKSSRGLSLLGTAKKLVVYVIMSTI